MSERNIPKIIHYCWFGGAPLPELAQKCLASWKRYCPDYKIIEWNETNFDLDMFPYARQAYEAKKYAFVSDVVRLYALLEVGGIYMDTDVEVVKNLDDLLIYGAVSGFESDTEIPTGLMAARSNHPMIKIFLEEYNSALFNLGEGSYDTTTNVTRITRTCFKYGFLANNTLQTINGFTLLPKDYLCPKDYVTGRLDSTSNTLTIHHFNGSWASPEDQYAKKMRQELPTWVPKRILTSYSRLRSIVHFRGVKGIPGYLREREDTAARTAAHSTTSSLPK